MFVGLSLFTIRLSFCPTETVMCMRAWITKRAYWQYFQSGDGAVVNRFTSDVICSYAPAEWYITYLRNEDRMKTQKASKATTFTRCEYNDRQWQEITAMTDRQTWTLSTDHTSWELQPRLTLHCVSKNVPTFKRYNSKLKRFWWNLVSSLKDKKLIKKQTYTKTETCKLYFLVFSILLPNAIKIDHYNFEL